jgi:hypothetical protein
MNSNSDIETENKTDKKIETVEEEADFKQNNKIINYDDYYDSYDFNLNNFKSKSGNTHRDNKQNSKKKNKNMSIYSSKHVRIQSSKKTNFMKK